MDRTYQHIFTPLTIRGITLKNRIEIAPISVFDLDTTPERHPPSGICSSSACGPWAAPP